MPSHGHLEEEIVDPGGVSGPGGNVLAALSKNAKPGIAEEAELSRIGRSSGVRNAAGFGQAQTEKSIRLSSVRWRCSKRARRE